MTKIDELIRELCPDGVQVFRLEEIAHYAKTRIDCKTINEDNYVGVENLLQSKAGKTKATSVPTTGMVIAYQKNDILIGNIRPYLRKVWLADCEGGTNGDVLTIQIEDTEKVLPQFLYYVLSSEKFFLYDIQNSKGAKMPRGSKDAVMKFEVPLPHLDVQHEIVRMLDSYTESVVELQKQLTAEFTARKTQYNYYRDYLLSYKDSVKKYTIAELADTNIGLATSVTQHKRNSGVVLIHNSDIQPNKVVLKSIEYVSEEFAEKNKKKVLRKGDIITVHTGDVGTSAVIDDTFDGAIGFTTITTRIRDRKEITPEYLCHYLNSQQCKRDIESVTISDRNNLNQKSYEKLTVPVPPLDVQNRIVNVLDNFEQICSDLNIGLPAEIEARQKQYEYYRDKLLTFAETGNTILNGTERNGTLIKLLQYVFGYAVVTLEDIAENCDSMRKPVTSGKREAGEYPYYGASGIVDYVKDYIFDGDYLLVSEDGANLLARSTPIAFSISGKNWVNNHAHVLKFDRYETRRFVEFYLNSIDLAPYISGGAQPKLSQKNLNRIEIPLPGQKRQKYIVDILDRFDAICNDLTSGLPAEIEARQKQYEYYRDKLLTFKEVAAT